MNSDLADKIAKLERELDAIKTSQFLGNSSTKIYKIVEGYTLNLSSYDADAISINFISRERPFPKISIVPRVFTINGVDNMSNLKIITPRAMFIQGFSAYNNLVDDTMQRREIEIPYQTEDVPIVFSFDLYADTRGDIEIYYLTIGAPG